MDAQRSCWCHLPCWQHEVSLWRVVTAQAGRPQGRGPRQGSAMAELSSGRGAGSVQHKWGPGLLSRPWGCSQARRGQLQDGCNGTPIPSFGCRELSPAWASCSLFSCSFCLNSGCRSYLHDFWVHFLAPLLTRRFNRERKFLDTMPQGGGSSSEELGKAGLEYSKCSNRVTGPGGVCGREEALCRSQEVCCVQQPQDRPLMAPHPPGTTQ